MLLARCVDAPLNRLSMSNCDLVQVRPWTMGLLAKFDKLKEVGGREIGNKVCLVLTGWMLSSFDRDPVNPKHFSVLSDTDDC